MQDLFLAWIFRLSLHRGRTVIAAVLGLTVLAALLIPGLRISSSYNDLVSPEEPEQARFLAFLEEFGAADDLVVVLEGEPAAVTAAADLFAAEIRREKEYVRSVFCRIDFDLLIARAPYFLPPEVLAGAREEIENWRPLIEGIARVDSLPALLQMISRQLAGEGTGPPLDPALAVPALRVLGLILREWSEFLEDPARQGLDYPALLAEAGGGEAEILAGRGYLLSRDRRLLFLFVRPTSGSDDLSFLRPFVGAVRRACGRVIDNHPRLAENVKVSFTGMPAHALTEVEAIDSDVAKSSAVSVGLVLAILALGFRSGRKIVLAVIPLACGMVITLGLIALAVGHLNLVSSSFLVVLFGIGIDFAIYLIRRTEEETGRGRTRQEAVRIAVTVSGRSVLIGGLTTGLAFLAVGQTDFVGFSELGITAGMGVLAVLLVTLFLLPALLIRWGVPAPLSRPPAARSFRGPPRPVTGLIATGAGALALFGFLAAFRVRFDFNALKLLPAGAESTVYQLRMQEESDIQMTAAVITEDDPGRLREQVELLRKLPTVSRVDTLTDLIPENPAEQAALIAGFRPYLSGLEIRPRLPGGSPAGYRAVLQDLVSGLEEAQDLAFAGGRAGMVSEIEGVRSAASALLELIVPGRETESGERTDRFEAALLGDLAGLSRLVGQWLQAGPPDESSFSPEFVGRFKSGSGRWAAYVFPAGSIWDVGFLDEFVAGLKAAAPAATGWPVTHQLTSRLMVASLLQSLLYALAIILVLLGLEYRRPAPVLLTLLPLGMAMLWVQGAFYLLGRDYDFASMPGLPLLIGLGIVYGVHVVSRWLERPEESAFAAASAAGRGVALAALTTMASLFGLVFSRHQGVVSFGVLLLIGIFSALVAALFVLPAVIDLIYYRQ